MGLAFLLSFSYCYSDETVYGSTNNAASAALNWTMSNILPQQAGLTVNGVVYRYTTVKNPEDNLVVYVQNKDALGDGYVFREKDDWTGLPGNVIRKIVPVNNININRWGDGSIETEGFGTVQDASVVYTYQYDPCFQANSPGCPGYVDPLAVNITEVEVVDPLDYDYIQQEMDRKATLKDQEQEDRDRKRIRAEMKSINDRLEKALSIGNNALMIAEAQVKEAQLFAMAQIPSSYEIELLGGEYEESIIIKDSKLPDNKKMFRNNLIQQILHEELVNSQYKNKK